MLRVVEDSELSPVAFATTDKELCLPATWKLKKKTHKLKKVKKLKQGNFQ